MEHLHERLMAVGGVPHMAKDGDGYFMGIFLFFRMAQLLNLLAAAG
jgi:hypothetical protein